MKLTGKNVDLGLLVLRLSIAISMLLHGIHKILHGIDGIEQLVKHAGFPACIAYGVYVGEVLVPVLLILGYKTRLMALVFAFNCLSAAWLTHKGNMFALNAQGGWIVELLGLFFFGALTLFFTGGGKYGLSKD
jgi:putative oxidoreductase